jgi:hypothetical protein
MDGTPGQRKAELCAMHIFEETREAVMAIEAASAAAIGARDVNYSSVDSVT